MGTTTAIQDQQVIGISELAEFLEVAERTPHSWGHRGLLPPQDFIVNGHRAWYRETIIRWSVNRGKVPPRLRAEAAQYQRASSNGKGSDG